MICAGPCSIDAVLDVDDSYKRVSKRLRVRTLRGDGRSDRSTSIKSPGGQVENCRVEEGDTYWRDEDLRPVRTARCRGEHRESRCVPLPVTHNHGRLDSAIYALARRGIFEGSQAHLDSAKALCNDRACVGAMRTGHGTVMRNRKREGVAYLF